MVDNEIARPWLQPVRASSLLFAHRGCDHPAAL